MSLSEEVLVPMLDRYLAGECSAAEAAEVRAWLSSNGHRAEVESVLADLRLWRDVAARRPAITSAEMAWRNTARVLELGGSTEAAVAPMRVIPSRGMHMLRRGDKGYSGGGRRSSVRAAWYAVVGAVVLLVVGGVWSTRHPKERLGRPAAVSTYATDNGQRATISLPDGSTVMLNVASRLEVAADYERGHRLLALRHGEALFTVAHHDGAPFTVIAGAAAVRVLGTSFAVRRYETDTVTTVAVRDGKVAVGSTVVTAAHAVQVGPGGQVVTRPADPGDFTFASGTLTIDGIPLAAAIPELNRWYDADVRLGDSGLAAQRIKGTFAAGSLADLAEYLEFVYDVRVVRAGRTLTLYQRVK